MIKRKELNMESDPDYEALKATELRIGNYYGWAHEESFSYNKADIDFIKTQKEYNEDPDDEQFCRGWWAFPIPLTEEWLLKLGFTTFGYGENTLYTDKRPFIGYRKHWVSGFLNIKNYFCLIGHHERHLNIAYVHQLQNLYFALTGEDLTIKTL